MIGLGAQLIPVVLYETRTRPSRQTDEGLLTTISDGSFVAFTSPSTVLGWFELVGEARARQILQRCVPIALGPTTSKALTDHDIVDHKVAPEATLAGVITVLLGTSDADR